MFFQNFLPVLEGFSKRKKKRCLLVTFVFPFFRQKQNNTFFFSWAFPSMNAVSKCMFFLPKKEKKKKKKRKSCLRPMHTYVPPFLGMGETFRNSNSNFTGYYSRYPSPSRYILFLRNGFCFFKI